MVAAVDNSCEPDHQCDQQTQGNKKRNFADMSGIRVFEEELPAEEPRTDELADMVSKRSCIADISDVAIPKIEDKLLKLMPMEIIKESVE